MSRNLSRREFLRQATLAGTAVPLAGSVAGSLLQAKPANASPRSANEKLNVGIIGVGGQGGFSLGGLSGQNIVALCDIDAQRLAPGAASFPRAKTYDDYRRVMDHKLDCVAVCTPDHMHAFATVAALQAGFDVYCEKPLAHSVWEVRQIRNWTAKQKAVTQLGTQIHAGDNYRRAVEIVKAGILGAVERVHVWFGGSVRVFKGITPQKPPAHVNYDLWTGPAPMRPFHPSHFHFNWRYWWDFGNGSLGDFGCHYMDLPYWALDLRAPVSVEARGGKGHDGENDCPNDLQVDYHYPARGDLPPVHLTWYQGKYRPSEMAEYGDGKGSAVLFEGTKGRLVADYETHKVFMGDGLDFTRPPQTIPLSPGHHAEFIEAVKTRGPTTCNFDYSGALTEAVLLGNVSYRAGGVKLAWDDGKLRAINCPEADKHIRRE
ncbi:MAG: Gfo/Idh/MocA family oxidoreductase [Planctomycetes bacterium]|nr:Gfo/Idh/MocA family oxidoreductase [Planctomycetota bacterium]